MAGDELIEAYLQRLDRRLAPMGRVRRELIVTETRDHLLEAAAVDGVDQALARFGTPAVVAGAHLEGQARARTLWALGTLAAAGLVYGAISALASPAAFGLFPGGPWPDDVPPSYLAWKVDVASSFVAAAAAVACSPCSCAGATVGTSTAPGPGCSASPSPGLCSSLPACPSRRSFSSSGATTSPDPRPVGQ